MNKASTTILRERIVFTLRSRAELNLVDICLAAFEGGITCFELTLNTPGSLKALSTLSRKDGLLVGAGTALNGDNAKKAAEAGAAFILSPENDPEVRRVCAELNLPLYPGAATPTEIHTAHRQGAEIVKVFPANHAGGPPFISALRGPLPDIPLFATHGVTLDNIGHYLRFSDLAVGLGRSIFSGDESMRQVKENASKAIEKAAPFRKPGHAE